DTFPAGQWRSRHGHATHACTPPARSDVRSAPERSAFPKARQLLQSEIVSGIGTVLSPVTGDECAHLFHCTETASCLQRRGRIRRSGLVAHPGCDTGLSFLQYSKLD